TFCRGARKQLLSKVKIAYDEEVCGGGHGQRCSDTMTGGSASDKNAGHTLKIPRCRDFCRACVVSPCRRDTGIVHSPARGGGGVLCAHGLGVRACAGDRYGRAAAPP